MAILKLVRVAEGGMTAAEVAQRTGLHLSTVRAHLDRLVAAGLMTRTRASDGQPGRPAWRYRALAEEPAPAPYRSLAGVFLDHLSRGGGDVSARAAVIGEDWGRQLAATVEPGTSPVDTMLRVLRRLGGDPRWAADETEIHLHTCPFLELVDRNPDAMCGLHLGVIRGALEYAGGAGDTAVLEPFGAPTACVVHLPAAGRDRDSRASGPAGRTSRTPSA